MNKIEASVYGLVRKYPLVKKTIKILYQGFFDLLSRKKDLFSGYYSYKEGFFFGFHDISPFSEDETKILAHKLPFDLCMPRTGDKMEIGYIDFKEDELGDFYKVTETTAWNYHKGCRLQWLDNKHIIYNTEKGGKLVSEITSLSTGESRCINHPIDSIYNSATESLATSFCYERLNRCMPGYGYSILNGDIVEAYPKDDGLFLIDLNSGEKKMLVSLYELAMNVGSNYLEDYSHFVTHTEFSKDGNYISFLYRCAPIGGEGKDLHKTFIIVYDLQRATYIVLPTQESGSHYVWNYKNEIIASCILDGKNCHVLYNVNTPNDYKIIAGKVLNSDGHQTFISDDVFITDTYPDKYRMTKLYKVNICDNVVELIASIYSPKQFQTRDVFKHIACDLHPRVSPQGKYVSFDSATTGKRSLFVMTLDK